MSWWNDMSAMCALHVVEGEQQDRDGPIAAAVRGAGYAPESEDEDENEGGAVVSSGGEDADREGRSPENDSTVQRGTDDISVSSPAKDLP